MDVTRETPGPKVGLTLHALLEEVLEDPTKNSLEYLENRAGELMKMDTAELQSLGEAGKKAKDEEEEKILGIIRGKHGV